MNVLQGPVLAGTGSSLILLDVVSKYIATTYLHLDKTIVSKLQISYHIFII